MMTTGSLKVALENTGRSSIDPTCGLARAPPAPLASAPRYADAIERMSMRPEPSPPPCCAAPPALGADDDADDDDADDAADARGASDASAARLPSENSTLFSLRSPRSFLSPPPPCAAISAERR